MNYLDFSAYIFKNELQKVIEREKNEPEYLKAEYFPDCEERATAGNAAACRQLAKIHALKIAEHRQEKHGEDHSKEIDSLVTEINPEYLEMLQQVEEPEFWLI